jgi:glycosyltransferase involved in cell wall biosynthesis
LIADLTIVVPLFNEEEFVRPLVAGIVSVSRTFGFTWELILVDGGSSDSTGDSIENLRAETPQLLSIRPGCNVGQTAAMVARFDHSLGKIIVTLDGDLQNDPADIPELLQKPDAGHDIASCWSKDRKEYWSRILPSRIANIRKAKCCFFSPDRGISFTWALLVGPGFPG